ncbi:hypothetical protein [Ammoniphilus sp. YIM 78166]|uniref:hypothetical protein n=1 Tax=Ammoniphilus sp. YIM 78166 TaxID=1644106 RepID=UPI00106F29A8|nr:hypothetical protein [Ammoniphilus sp. YIM 78166]
MEQLVMFEEIPKEEWYSKTVTELKKYPAMKLAVDAADLQDDQEHLEKKRKKVKLIELALSPLTPEERQIIELSYFTRHKQKDVYIQRQVGMAHSCFYDTKDEVMRHIATVLNIL